MFCRSSSSNLRFRVHTTGALKKVATVSRTGQTAAHRPPRGQALVCTHVMGGPWMAVMAGTNVRYRE